MPKRELTSRMEARARALEREEKSRKKMMAKQNKNKLPHM
jgi:hypothetical protein